MKVRAHYCDAHPRGRGVHATRPNSLGALLGLAFGYVACGITECLPAVYLSSFRRQSSTYVVWEGISDALSGCSHSFRTWIHPRREYLYRISLRRLSLRNAARVRCATSLISVSVCRSVWLHVGLYVYVCVCPCFRFFSGPVRTRPCPRAMRSRWSAQDRRGPSRRRRAQPVLVSNADISRMHSGLGILAIAPGTRWSRSGRGSVCRWIPTVCAGSTDVRLRRHPFLLSSPAWYFVWNFQRLLLDCHEQPVLPAKSDRYGRLLNLRATFRVRAWSLQST